MVNGKTGCYAVIGKPIGHSLSPVMQNQFFNSVGLNSIYIPLEVEKDDLKKAIHGLHALGFKGVNVTIPYKEAVIPYLEEISREAKLIGAVNTLIATSEGFRGENTDGRGLLKALKVDQNWEPAGKKVVILGAGGAAKAVAISLALAGAKEVTMINRTVAKANAITKVIEREIGIGTKACSFSDAHLNKIVNEADILINTTPLGMTPNVDAKPPLDLANLTKDQLVVDLIYNPLKTRFLLEAQEKGCEIYSGLGMLIHQGALAFKLWTNKEPILDGIEERLIYECKSGM